MKGYSLVLSDELQSEYHNFIHGKSYNRKLIEKLLHYYKPSILTNTAQLERICVQIDNNLHTKLRKAGYTNQTLEELVKKTDYKIILSTDKDQYPYVNINKDKIENNLSGCFFKNENRQKAIDHIAALCSKIDTIYIYDRYFSNYEAANNLQILNKIFPKKKLTIIYHPNHINDTDITTLQTYCSDWILQKKFLNSHHDRYLILDDKMEVILTSGFSYLSNTDKEFTYVIRPVSQERF